MRFSKRLQVTCMLVQLFSMSNMMTSAHGEQSAHRTGMNEIKATIASIKTSGSTRQRTDFAWHLSVLIRKEDPANIDVDTIDEITGLLRDRDDSVRYWAAASLGYLGQHAERAIPALRTALLESACLPGTKTSASGIIIALRKIGIEPEVTSCQNPSAK